MESLKRRHTWHISPKAEDAEDVSIAKIRALTDERELVQKRTFTNWINSHFCGSGSEQDVRGFQIKDLYEDCSNGRVLIKLIEILSGDKLPKTSNGKMRIHHLENVDKALEYLRSHNCQLENVHAHDIVDGNPKIILGLFWKMILKYQFTGLESIVGKKLTEHSIVGIKKSLLQWCRTNLERYPNVTVSDFTITWKDGRAFSALLHSHRPDLLDFQTMEKSEPLDRLDKVFAIARDVLDVPTLLDPKDLVAYQDEKSIIIYLSSLYQAFHRMPLPKVRSEASRPLFLSKVCEQWIVRKNLTKAFEAQYDKFLHWMVTQTDNLSAACDLPPSQAKVLLKEAGNRDSSKLREWTQVILSHHAISQHCKSNDLQGIQSVMLKGRLLSLLEKSWSKLQKASNKCENQARIMQQNDSYLEKKASLKVEKLSRLCKQASESLLVVESKADILKTETMADRITSVLGRTLQFMVAAQARSEADFSAHRARLSDISAKVGILKEEIKKKKEVFTSDDTTLLLAKANGLAEHLNDLKASITHVNNNLDFKAASATFQLLRCRQLSCEVQSYATLVTRTMKCLTDALSRLSTSSVLSQPSNAHHISSQLAQSSQSLGSIYKSLSDICGRMEIEAENTTCSEKMCGQTSFDAFTASITEEQQNRLQKREIAEQAAMFMPSNECDVDVELDESCTNEQHLQFSHSLNALPEPHDHTSSESDSAERSSERTETDVHNLLGEDHKSSSECSTTKLPRNDVDWGTPSQHATPDSSCTLQSDLCVEKKTLDEGTALSVSDQNASVRITSQVDSETSALAFTFRESRGISTACASSTLLGPNSSPSLLSQALIASTQPKVSDSIIAVSTMPDDKCYRNDVSSPSLNTGKSSIAASGDFLEEIYFLAKALVDDVILYSQRVVLFDVLLLDRTPISVLLQVEAEWLSELKMPLESLKAEANVCQSTVAHGNTLFGLIQRYQFIAMETGNHFIRVECLKKVVASTDSRERHATELMHEALAVLQLYLNSEVASLTELMDAGQYGVQLDLALQWYSEQELVIQELDAPGGSIDVAHQLNLVKNLLLDAQSLHKSLNLQDESVQLGTNQGPILPEKISLVTQMYDFITSLMHERIALLSETLQASTFSEWGDVFAVWLVEKKNSLSKFRVPHNVEIAESYLVHFKNCLTATLMVAKTSLEEWQDRVRDMADSCPTFSRGVQHIYITLKQDYTEYEERLQSLLENQELQLSVRYQLFTIEDLIKEIKGCMDRMCGEDADTLESSEALFNARLLETSVEHSSLEKQFTAVQRATIKLIQRTPPHEVGRTFLTSDLKQLDSIWDRFGVVYTRKRELYSELLSYFRLSLRVGTTVSNMEYLLVSMDEPFDERSEYLLLQAIQHHKEQIGCISAIAVESQILLRDAASIWHDLICHKPAHVLVLPKFLKLRELWAELHLFWDTRKELLTEYFLSRKEAESLTNVESVLSNLIPDSLLKDSESESEATISEDVLSSLEQSLLANEDAVAKLHQFRADEAEDPFNGVVLHIPVEANFAFLHAKLSSSGKLSQPHNDFIHCVSRDSEMEPWMGHRTKGILKRPAVLKIAEDTKLNESDRYLASSPPAMKNTFSGQFMEEVMEENVACETLDEELFRIDWDGVFGSSMFRDSPLIDSVSHKRSGSRAVKEQHSSPPVIERSHAVLARDTLSNFWERADELLDLDEDGLSKESGRRVKFSPVVPKCFLYTPEHELLPDEEILSLDSFDSTNIVFKDTQTAMDDLFHVVSDVRGKGSLWSWRNNKKPKQPGQDSSAVVSHHVVQTVQKSATLPQMHTPQLSFSLSRDADTESSRLDEDGDGEMLYSVGSLSSIIERYEGRLFRKHVTDAWNRKASRRSWKLFHAVVYQGQISFYKDAKLALMGRESSPSLFLRDARCDIAHDYTKRPHIFRVVLHSGAEYLFEANTYMELDEWVQNINSQISHNTLPTPLIAGSPQTAYEERGRKGKKGQKVH